MSGVSHSWLALGFCECLVSFRWGNTCWLDKYCCMEGVDILVYSVDVGDFSSKVEGSCIALYIEVTW